MRIPRILLKTIFLLFICIPLYTQAKIDTYQVQKKQISQEIVLDAQVEAINKTTLAAQTSGQIMAIYFDAGDMVPANSILLKLKDNNQRANFNSAQAALKANKAELVDAKNSLRRIKNIFAKKLSSKQLLDNAKARFNIAKANYEGALAQLRSAKEQLSYTLVKTPYAGVLLERHVNLGEIVVPGTPLFTGTSLNKLRVVSQIPQQDIEKIRHYSDVIIDLPNGEKFNQQGDNLKFYAYASPLSSTFKVRIKLPKNSKTLYPGMYLKTHFKIGDRNALVVPNSSIIKRSELRAVYIQDQLGKIHLRQVRVGNEINTHFTEILAGLSINENVVIHPHHVIRELTSRAQIEVK